MHSSTWARTRSDRRWSIGGILEIDGLDRAEGAFGLAQALVDAYKTSLAASFVLPRLVRMT